MMATAFLSGTSLLLGKDIYGNGCWVSEGERRCRGRKHTLGVFKSLSVGRKIRNYHGSSLVF